MSRHDKRKSPQKPKRPKTKLGLPDLDHSKSAVLDSLRSPESKRGYRHAIDELIQWYCSEPGLSFNKVVVTRYRIFLESRRLAAGTINGRLAAVRRLAYEAADAGLLSPEHKEPGRTFAPGVRPRAQILQARSIRSCRCGIGNGRLLLPKPEVDLNVDYDGNGFVGKSSWVELYCILYAALNRGSSPCGSLSLRNLPV